jgi:hypothetical protein
MITPHSGMFSLEPALSHSRRIQSMELNITWQKADEANPYYSALAIALQ